MFRFLPRHPSPNTFLDHGAIKFGKDTQRLKHSLADYPTVDCLRTAQCRHSCVAHHPLTGHMSFLARFASSVPRVMNAVRSSNASFISARSIPSALAASMH